MERSYYIDDFVDEVMPCEPTLDAWALWLSKPDPEWYHDIPAEGQVFAGSAIAWEDDIVATRVNGEWSLSRDPSDNAFVAVRYGFGSGWSAEQIVTAELGITDSGFAPVQTMAEALLAWFRENDDCCYDTEYVAVGQNENGWQLTYCSSPQPHLVAERAQ